MQEQVISSQTAILIVGYGALSEEGQATYQEVEDRIRELYPEGRVEWAYTSDIVRQRLRAQGKTLLAVGDALSALDNEGYERVVVLPLYVVQGEAYSSLKVELNTTLPLPHLRRCALASPLLHDGRDSEIVSRALLASLPDEDEENAPARILFMGHGSEYEAGNAAYDDVDDLLDRMRHGARLALLNGESFETLLAEWGEGYGEKVLLRPFFFTIGHHSLEDLGGEGQSSWKTRLNALGYDCSVDLIALSDLPDITQLLLEHLREAVSELEGA